MADEAAAAGGAGGASASDDLTAGIEFPAPVKRTAEEMEVLNSLKLGEGATPNPQQAAILAEMRELVKPALAKLKVSTRPEVTGDVRLLKFLMGWEWDLGEAAKAYIAMMKWREENGCDAVLERIIGEGITCDTLPHSDEVAKYLAARCHHGYDKLGNTIHLEYTGLLDVHGIVEDVPREHLLEWHKYHMEAKMLLHQRGAVERQYLVRTTNIRDLTGLGMGHLWKPALDLFKRVLGESQNYYPEMLDSVFIVNAPWAFTVAWKLIRGWLHPRTQAKINVLGSDFQSVLLERIDADQLPVRLGGTCNCEGGCVRVPDHLAADMRLVALDVARSDSETVSVPVEGAGKVAWRFLCEAHDITFSAIFNPKQEDGVEISDSPTVVCSPERCENKSGLFDAPGPGALEFVFDNTFSWTRGKTVKYDVMVVGGGESDDDEPAAPSSSAE